MNKVSFEQEDLDEFLGNLIAAGVIKKTKAGGRWHMGCIGPSYDIPYSIKYYIKNYIDRMNNG